MLFYVHQNKGGHKMAEIKKIKRATFALFTAISLTLVWFIIDSIINLLRTTVQWNAASVSATAVCALIMLAIFSIALFLLKSVRADETPFNPKNVKRLKAIALLLVVFEPYMVMHGWLMQKLYPIVLEGGTISVSARSSLGGVVFAAGLVVYVIALVFAYGISLQQQVDETL